ncbi:MAG: hypothetical protein GY826_27475, partial [Fuerstiella sp.]|nr:hypothetical protein [Fuerstiella sp.]
DNCPDKSNPGQKDRDGDGVGNACDNCPDKSNPGQKDRDNDGVGNVCDNCPNDPADDADNDGICADEDNCPDVANPDQTDSDSNGVGDACDECPDADQDTVCDDVDNCPNDANMDQADADGDDIGDVCDPTPLGEDFGDAPDSYGTLLADGTRHTIVEGYYLGAGVDAELNGQPSSNADGDDLNGDPDDEDGVILPSELTAGANAVSVTVTAGPEGGKLDAWIDFDGNGVFDADERIAGTNGRTLNVGENTIYVNVPENATLGETYARFRLSSANSDSLEPTGSADEGEVEDYLVEIVCLDSDADGVCDNDDNCPNTPNADQADADNDGVGDACEED